MDNIDWIEKDRQHVLNLDSNLDDVEADEIYWEEKSEFEAKLLEKNDSVSIENLESIKGSKKQACHKCGRKLPLDKTYCWYCGTIFDLDDQKEGRRESSRQSKGDYKTSYLIGINVILAIVGILLIVFGVQVHGMSEPAGTTMIAIGAILLVLIALEIVIASHGECFYSLYCLRFSDCDGDCDCDC